MNNQESKVQESEVQSQPLYFEDILWLFKGGLATRGLIRLNLEEAGLLWKIAREARLGILEVGRCHAGSTCLLAAASADAVPIVSLDVNPTHRAACEEFLAGHCWRVQLLTGNSLELTPPGPFDLVFIDGDHTYAGVSGDFWHHRPTMTAGATVVFHDAVAGSIGVHKGVQRFCEELLARGLAVEEARAESLLVLRLVEIAL